MEFSLFYDLKPFKIDKPIRLITLFSGYDAQALGLKYLGVPFEHYRTCEWAVKSIHALKDIHFAEDTTDYSKDMVLEDVYRYLINKGISQDYNQPMSEQQVRRLGEKQARTIYNNIQATHNLVNIQQVHGDDLGVVDTDRYDYLVTYSFPCFTADSLVLTKNGYKRIVDICIDDEVLSHDNKYHKVVNRFENGIHDIYKINAMGIDEIKTTYNHKFYVREKYRKGHKAIRCFKEPAWKELKDLTNNDYLGIAINQQNRSIVSNKLPTQEKDFWWIIGRYLGDGWIRQQGGIIICCAKDETYEIISKLENLNWNYNIVNERTVNKIHISKKALSDFVEQFGKGAGKKHLTQDILDLPISYLKPFIKGYLSADGCFTNGTYKATSISRELIYGIAQCVAKTYQTPYRIYKIIPPKKKVIEGRLVNQNIWYQLVFKTEKKKQDRAFYEDGYIWYPIKSIESIGKDYVYDIEVEDSHSFTVQNTIVHNCQDLSLAGKGAGMERGSGTRSGMLWEVERILTECKELPQILVMENVPEVVGTKNIKHFEEWLLRLEQLGYTNSWKILNAKDFGIPQNRRRCFMVSILGNYQYEFPKTIPLRYRLKDVLEKNVDEKYYLSSKMLLGMQNTKFESYKLENKVRDKDDVAATIIARFDGAPQCVEEDNYVGTFDWNKSETFMHGKDRLRENASISDTILTTHTNGVVLKEPVICASRGRNPQNPSSRKSGEKTEQRIEVNPSGCSNTLTTVQKDNYVLEPNLKQQLCDGLIENGLVKEGDVIRHSYSNSRMDNFYANNQVEHDCSPTLDTRCDCLGVVVKEDDRDIDNPLKDKSPYGWHFEQNVYSENSKVVRTLKAGEGSGNIPKVVQDEIIELNRTAKHQQDLVQHEDGICRTICAGTHGSAPHLLKTAVSDELIEHPIENIVRVRKFDVNKGALSELLIGAKEQSKLSNKEIAERLSVPQTEVEHWFRRDEYFSIPSENIWLKLKELLKIESNEFDESILTFEERPSGFDMSNRAYDEKGCSPTLTTQNTTNVVTSDEPRVIGGIGEKKSNGGTQWYEQDRIYDDKVATAITTGFNPYYKTNYRIRKLTPKECLRLMALKDFDIEKVSKNQSNASLYHMAGDSIVVSCLMALFGQLLGLDWRDYFKEELWWNNKEEIK